MITPVELRGQSCGEFRAIWHPISILIVSSKLKAAMAIINSEHIGGVRCWFFVLTALLLTINPEICRAQVKANLNGFKEIRFDMPISELHELGFKCGSDPSVFGFDKNEPFKCTETNKVVFSRRFTIFHMPVIVLPQYRDNKVKIIDLIVEADPQILINKYKEVLGAPIKFIYKKEINYSMATIEVNMWTFMNGATISMQQPKGGPFVNLGVSRVTYRNAEFSQELFEKEKAHKENAHDF